jgi:transposase
MGERLYPIGQCFRPRRQSVCAVAMVHHPLSIAVIQPLVRKSCRIPSGFYRISLCVDAHADAVPEKLKAKVQVAKRNALHTFTVIPQRWIVERSFGWLEQSRRLWKNPERLLNTSLQFIHLAFLSLLLKRL